MRREFAVGEFCEEIPWMYEDRGIVYTAHPCPHAVPDPHAEQTFARIGLSPFRIPRLITARNEGGHNCVQLCLDCILDALRTSVPEST